MTGKAIHGLSYTPEYRAWQTMRLRCTEPTNPAYKDYGGRGISVCARWLDSPAAFLEDMGAKPTPEHELDRYPDNNGNYEPGNCRWATRKENDRNRRSNRLIEFGDETMALAAWAERVGMGRDTLRKRLEAGWTVEEALTIPSREKAGNGEAKTYTRPCIDCGKPTTGVLRCRSCENRSRAVRASR